MQQADSGADVALPRYERLRRNVLEGIAAGRWPVGSRLPSEGELAREFQVSRITVRRALEELRRQGVIATSRGRRARVLAQGPTANAPSERRRRTQSGVYAAGGRRRPAVGPAASSEPVPLVLVCIPWLSPAATMPLWRGIEGVLRPRGWAALVVSSDNDPVLEGRLLAQVRGLGARGVLVQAAQGAAAALLREAAASREVPLVYVGRYHPEGVADCVVVDNVGGAAQATRLLLERGHRRIAFVNGREREVTAVTDRLRGYCLALEQAGLSVDFGLVWMDWLVRGGTAEEVRDHLSRTWTASGATAALAVNGRAARELRAHLQSLALDAEVVAFIGEEPPESLGLVASVQVPFEAMGAEAAKLLCRRLDGDWADWPCQQVLPVQLQPTAAAEAGVQA